MTYKYIHILIPRILAQDTNQSSKYGSYCTGIPSHMNELNYYNYGDYNKYGGMEGGGGEAASWDYKWLNFYMEINWKRTKINRNSRVG